jgi:hypothetical protein
MDTKKNTVKLAGPFGTEDAVDILRDGQEIGYVERLKGERFASASSRARVSFVSGYQVNLDAADGYEVHDFDTLPEVRAFLKTL